MEDNSAAAMIRRFREGKPTSRDEREKKKEASGVSKLWYENDGDMPRSLAVEPTAQPRRPNPALRSVRASNDYMSDNSLFRNTKLGDSLAVDDLIEKEIRQLEENLREQNRRTNNRLDLGSFQPTRSLDLRNSLGDTRDSGTYRFDRSLRDNSPMRMSGDILKSSIETLGSTGFRGLLVPKLKLDGKKEEEPKKEEKSDAQMAELNKNLEDFLNSMKEAHPPKNPYFPEGVEESIMQVTNKVHSDMLDMMNLFGDRHQEEDAAAKAQKERDEQMREEGRKQAREKQLLDLDLPASHPLEYFGVWDGQQQQQHPGIIDPSAVPYLQHLQPAQVYAPQPAPQAPMQSRPAPAGSGTGAPTDYGVVLETDLAALRLSDESSLGSPFPQYNNKSAILSPEAHGGAAAGLPTIKEGFPVGNEEQGAVKMTPAAGEDGAPAGPTLLQAGILGNLSPQRVYQAAPAAAQPHPSARAAMQGQIPVRGLAPGVGLVQAAVDVEMSAADELVAKMRALRTGLGVRMRHLDALHGAVMPTPASYRPVPAGANGPVGLPLYARPYGPPPAPVHGHGGNAWYYQGHQYGGPQGHQYGSAHPGGPQYWGLEAYYEAQEQERLASIARPPEYMHMDVYGVAKGVTSVLDTTMTNLKAHLPEVVVKPPAPVPQPSPSLSEATVAAAAKLILSAHSEAKPTASDASKVATAFVEGLLHAKDATKKPEATTATASAPAAAAAPAHSPAAPAATPIVAAAAKPATPPAPLPKAPKDMLSEMDTVLGAEDRRSNYLARDLLSANHAAAPSTLAGADNYLLSAYGPGPWDARLQYDARRRQAMKRAPIIIRAPSDRQLQEQYGQGHASVAIPSAPPAGLDYTTPRAPSPQRGYPTARPDLYPPIAQYPPTAPPPASASADPRRVVQFATNIPPRRPVEGTALEYLRGNQIGVISTDAGKKYVNPYPDTSYTSPSRGLMNPQYVPPDVARQYQPASGSQAHFGVPVPSPTSVAVHEHTGFLQQMRKVRENMMAT